MGICPDSSEVAEFYLRKWLSASCNRWVIPFNTSALFLRRIFFFTRVPDSVSSGVTGRTSGFRLCWLVSLFLIVFFCVSLLKACALQFLHERNISHLDLKPQNILLCGSVLKLAGDQMSSQTQMISEKFARRPLRKQN